MRASHATVCNYIYETWPVPGSLDAMHLMWFMQAHHLDTDYYDMYFDPALTGLLRRPFGSLASLGKLTWLKI